jgi:hypothetical protein
MQLESGIVVALLIAAVLVYDRLGGNDELARRMFQVGLAISLVFLALSATHAFIRPDESGNSILFSSSGDAADATDTADRAAAATTIHYGVGVLLLVTGLGMLNRFHTISLGFAGGVLLLFAGASFGGLALTNHPLGPLRLAGGRRRDVRRRRGRHGSVTVVRHTARKGIQRRTRSRRRGRRRRRSIGLTHRRGPGDATP